MKGGISRRNFVRGAVAMATAAPFLSPRPTAAKSAVNIDNMIIINGLGGISNQNRWVRRRENEDESIGAAALRRIRSIDARAIDDTHAAGITAINVTLGYVAGPEQPYEYTVDDIARWNAIIRSHPDDLLKVWTAADILRAKRENRIGIIFGFQNASCLGDRVERVRTFAELGVRVVQLTYNDANQLGGGSAAAEDHGLSAFGHEVVRALNASRMLIDLSHSSRKTCLDAIRASGSPLTISHTGCRELNDIPRNKTDEELRLVAEGGGVVGIYFMPFLKQDGQARAADVVRHVEHAIRVCGEDHVGIGTDGDATAIDDMPAYRRAIAGELRQRQQAGISAAGESGRIVPLIPDLMGPAQFSKLADLLHRRGHSEQRIEKALGGNFLRLMREVWRA